MKALEFRCIIHYLSNGRYDLGHDQSRCLTTFLACWTLSKADLPLARKSWIFLRLVAVSLFLHRPFSNAHFECIGWPTPRGSEWGQHPQLGRTQRMASTQCIVPIHVAPPTRSLHGIQTAATLVLPSGAALVQRLFFSTNLEAVRL